jgi:hypothetical protein
MISGWFSGQPVAKAVTKSADVERVVIGRVLYSIMGLLLSATMDAGGEAPPRIDGALA